MVGAAGVCSLGVMPAAKLVLGAGAVGGLGVEALTAAARSPPQLPVLLTTVPAAGVAGFAAIVPMAAGGLGAADVAAGAVPGGVWGLAGAAPTGV